MLNPAMQARLEDTFGKPPSTRFMIMVLCVFAVGGAAGYGLAKTEEQSSGLDRVLRRTTELTAICKAIPVDEQVRKIEAETGTARSLFGERDKWVALDYLFDRIYMRGCLTRRGAK